MREFGKKYLKQSLTDMEFTNICKYLIVIYNAITNYIIRYVILSMEETSVITPFFLF